nr:MAG TPA_asm: hypothetical protein [Caudoviricetes sp.]
MKYHIAHLQSAVKRLKLLQQFLTHCIGQRYVITLRLATTHSFRINKTPRTLFIYKHKLSTHRDTTISVREVLRVQINVNSQALLALLSAIFELPFKSRNRTVHIINIDSASAGEMISFIKLRLNFHVMLVIQNDIHFIFPFP